VSTVDLFDDDLPQIPDRVYFTIGEASRLCGVKPHVLRYWEQEFEQLQPDKRRGNRRYYRYQDLIMIRRIRALVHQQGFTLSGAKLRIQEEDEARVEATHDDSKGMALREVIRELEQVRQLCLQEFEISRQPLDRHELCCPPARTDSPPTTTLLWTSHLSLSVAPSPLRTRPPFSTRRRPRRGIWKRFASYSKKTKRARRSSRS